MDSGFDHVRSILGDEDAADVTDHKIKESLWHYYFDGEKTVAWLLEEKEKAQKKKEKKNGELNLSCLSIRSVCLCECVRVRVSCAPGLELDMGLVW